MQFTFQVLNSTTKEVIESAEKLSSDQMVAKYDSFMGEMALKDVSATSMSDRQSSSDDERVLLLSNNTEIRVTKSALKPEDMSSAEKDAVIQSSVEELFQMFEEVNLVIKDVGIPTEPYTNVQFYSDQVKKVIPTISDKSALQLAMCVLMRSKGITLETVRAHKASEQLR